MRMYELHDEKGEWGDEPDSSRIPDTLKKMKRLIQLLDQGVMRKDLQKVLPYVGDILINTWRLEDAVSTFRPDKNINVWIIHWIISYIAHVEDNDNQSIESLRVNDLFKNWYEDIYLPRQKPSYRKKLSDWFRSFRR